MALHTLLIFIGSIFDWKHRLQVFSIFLISFLSFVWQSKPISLSMILYSNAKKGLFVPKHTGCTICKHLFATFFWVQNPRRWRHLVCLGSSVSHILCQLNSDCADIWRVRHLKLGLGSCFACEYIANVCSNMWTGQGIYLWHKLSATWGWEVVLNTHIFFVSCQVEKQSALNGSYLKVYK